jgi:hypothetical protein
MGHQNLKKVNLIQAIRKKIKLIQAIIKKIK